VRLLCASVLFFEAVVVGLAIPTALALTEGRRGLIVWGGLALVVLCLVAAAMLRSRAGYVLGSLVQLAVLASGFVLPGMFFLGVIFGGLWVLALVLPGRAARVQAQRFPPESTT